MLMLGQATSWLPGGRGGRLVLRLVTNLPSQVKQYMYTVFIVSLTSMLVAQWLRQLAVMHMILGSYPALCNIFSFCISCSWQSEIVHALYVHGIYMV
jgi:hypothetical protein